jgi:hypothetical protein
VASPHRSLGPPRRALRIALWVVCAGLVAAAAWLAGERGRAAVAPPPGPAAAAAAAPAEILIELEEPGTAASVTGFEGGGGGAARFAGFCPSEGPEIERPDLATLVNERVAELVDRARAAQRGRGSVELRRALVALYAHTEAPEEALAAIAAAPDRVDGGFDHVAAAAVTVGVRALRDGRWDEVRRWAGAAAHAAPADPAPWALLAIAERRAGAVAAEREALWAAFERAPDEPSVGLAVGRAFADTELTDRAVVGLSAYLAEHPADAVVAGLEARLRIRADLQRDLRRLDRGGVTLLWPEDVDDAVAAATLDAVLDALERAATLLGAPRRADLTVWVHGARADMLAVTCVQGWARAVYDGSLHLDGEGLADRERMAVHVDHETLHAQLAAVAPRAPVWLHEGLAQHFAGQRSARCLETWSFMVRNETWVPFASLDGSFQVITDSDDAGLAYHQSLAMVEMLLARGGPAAVRRSVAYLTGPGDPGRLLEHLGGDRPFTGRELLETIERTLEQVERGR